MYLQQLKLLTNYIIKTAVKKFLNLVQSLTLNGSTGDSQKRRLLAPCRRGTATIARKTALKTRYSGQGTIGPATNKALLLESIWPPHKAPDLFILIKWTFFALRLVFYWADILYPGTYPLSPAVLLVLVLNSDWMIKTGEFT